MVFGLGFNGPRATKEATGGARWVGRGWLSGVVALCWVVPRLKPRFGLGFITNTTIPALRWVSQLKLARPKQHSSYDFQ